MKTKQFLFLIITTLLLLSGCNALDKTYFSDENPSVSSDGEWLIYSRILANDNNKAHGPYGIYKISMNGKDKVFLLESATTPSLSPNNKQILYEMGIFTIEGNTIISNFVFKHMLGIPSWSIDGSSIIYNEYRNIIIADTLLNNKKELPIKGNFAKWMPNGKQIIYAQSGICIYDTIEAKIIKLTDNSLDDSPTCSPNGKTVVWSRGGELWLMNADGSNQRFLAVGASAAWCPDSKHIVYSKPSNNGKFGKFKFYFLWKLNIETGKEKQITKEF